jgi:hypothetical protein
VYQKRALVSPPTQQAEARSLTFVTKFHRLKARGGYKRAAVAIAHKILVSVYQMLSRNVSYNELRDPYLDNLNKHRLTRNLVSRLERRVIQ